MKTLLLCLHHTAIVCIGVVSNLTWLNSENMVTESSQGFDAAFSGVAGVALALCRSATDTENG